MGFDRFGRVSHVQACKVDAFVDSLDAGRVQGVECSSCGRRFFPPCAHCGSCLDDKMRWFEIEGAGELLTYSTTYFAPTGFEGIPPYTLAVAEFPLGVKIFGTLSQSITDDTAHIGMKVRISVVRLDNGHVTYEFISDEP